MEKKCEKCEGDLVQIKYGVGVSEKNLNTG